MKNANILLGVAAVGSALLILSEIVEVAGGGFSQASFAVTIAAFFAVSAGIWGLHAARAAGGGRLSFAGAALLSAGALVQGVADTLGFGSATEAELVARTGPLVGIGGPLFVFGAMLFGAGVLLAGTHPRWSGVLLVAAPPLLPAVTLLGLPLVGTSIAHALVGAALLAMGLRVRSSRSVSLLAGAGR